jgi:hypothetical protein
MGTEGLLDWEGSLVFGNSFGHGQGRSLGRGRSCLVRNYVELGDSRFRSRGGAWLLIHL